MDQLKPLIKHHYWICFGFAVIFVVVGWWIASGSIAEATAARKTSVEDSFSKAKQGADAPNQRWIEAAQKENAEDDQAYDESSRSLWQRQKNARVWPDDVANEMKGIAYFDQIPNSVTRGKWGAGYGKQFDALLEIIRPFQMKDGSGLVLVDKKRITHKPYDSWRIKAPLSEEVWKNQEDLWLLKSLLTSLARVNEGANRITEASLRQIIALRLRGGDPNATPMASAGGGMGGPPGMGMGGFGGGFGGGGGSSEAAGEDGGMGMMGGGMGRGGMGGAAGAASGPWKAFEGTFGMDLLTEEFGPVGGAGGMMGGGMMGGAMGNMTPGGSGGGFGAYSGGGTTAPASGETDRYVHEAEDLPYKTRAFLLHAKVREDQIARLLAELTNSDFPVEIVRVDLKTFSSGGGAAGGMMTGGPGGGSMGLGMSGDGSAGYAGSGGSYGEDSYAGGEMGSAGGEMMADGGLDDPILGGTAGFGGDESGSAYGEDPYGGYGANTGMPGIGMETQTGKQVLAAAMTDPALVEIRVAGLMTLYQSQEETEAQIETEAASVEESAEASPGMPPLVEETPDSDAPTSTPDESVSPTTDANDGTERSVADPEAVVAPATETVPETSTDPESSAAPGSAPAEETPVGNPAVDPNAPTEDPEPPATEDPESAGTEDGDSDATGTGPSP